MQPAHLTYYPDDRPGITRHRHGRGFTYRAADGTTIADAGLRKWLKSLAVPPAYENVWITPKRNGHLLATGHDVRARKQYRYHPDWRAWRETTKFSHLADFGAALPRIRRRIAADLNGEAGERDFAVAAMLTLIDRTAIRVGTPEYADENGSFGATTLRGRHLRMTDGVLTLRYTAKGGQKVRTRLTDRKLARVLSALHDLPGATLASWTDDEGNAHAVTSEEVNARLAEIGGAGMTAKTFRTWAGSTAAMEAALRSDGAPTIKALSEAAASRLHNTPTIARNSYIHPAVIALSEADTMARHALGHDLPEVRGLRTAERALLRLIG